MSAPLRHTGDRGLRDRRPRRAVRDRRPDVSRWIEAQTGWSTRKFVRTARRHWVIEIQAGGHCITAADPLPSDLQKALTLAIHAGPVLTGAAK